MPSTGGVNAHVNVRPARLLRYSSTIDLAILGLEISMLLLIIFDLMEKVCHNDSVQICGIDFSSLVFLWHLRALGVAARTQRLGQGDRLHILRPFPLLVFFCSLGMSWAYFFRWLRWCVSVIVRISSVPIFLSMAFCCTVWFLCVGFDILLSWDVRKEEKAFDGLLRVATVVACCNRPLTCAIEILIELSSSSLIEKHIFSQKVCEWFDFMSLNSHTIATIRICLVQYISSKSPRDVWDLYEFEYDYYRVVPSVVLLPHVLAVCDLQELWGKHIEVRVRSVQLCACCVTDITCLAVCFLPHVWGQTLWTRVGLVRLLVPSDVLHLHVTTAQHRRKIRRAAIWPHHQVCDGTSTHCTRDVCHLHVTAALSSQRFDQLRFDPSIRYTQEHSACLLSLS